MIQQYLNPFYRPQALGAAYGLCSLTHLSERAGKIQNTALRVVALAFSILMDATLGFGIIGTVAYNSGALLYNAGSKVKHLYQKYRGIEESAWNQTALKTWALMGTASLLGTLYYCGIFGRAKQWIFPSNKVTQEPSLALHLLEKTKRFFPSMSTSFACLSGVVLTGIIARIGYLYSRLPSFDTKKALTDFIVLKEQYEVKKQKQQATTDIKDLAKPKENFEKNEAEKKIFEKILNRSWWSFGYVEPWACHFSVGAVRFLSKYGKKCKDHFYEAYSLRLSKPDFWTNKETIAEIDEMMRANYMLSFLALNDFKNYIRRANVSNDKLTNWKEMKALPPLVFCFKTLRDYAILRTKPDDKEIFDQFYEEGTPHNSWREMQNQLIEQFNKIKEEYGWKIKDELLQALTTKDENKNFKSYLLKDWLSQLPQLPKNSSFGDWFFSRGKWAHVTPTNS